MLPFIRCISSLVCASLLLISCAQSTPTPEPTKVQEATAVVDQPTVAVPQAPPKQDATKPPQPTATVLVEPTVEQPKQGGELVVGLSAEPSKIDPHRTATADAIIATMQACETLVIMDSDLNYVPGLAESWEISQDGKTYTFNLRKGINFQDGTPFNAEAVKYNFDRIVDPNTKSEQSINVLAKYLFTEVVDEYTARIYFDEPYAPFMEGVSSGWLCMVSPTAAQQWGPEEFQDHFIGTGPFILKEWKRGEYIRLERNPDYWGGPEFFDHQGLAYLDAVVFKFITESGVRAGAVTTGELQVVSDVPALEVERLQTEDDLEIIIDPPPGTPVLLVFNMSKAPTDDILVRKALEYAINPQAFSDILYNGVHAAAYGPLSPTSQCYWEGVEDMYGYDPEKAKELLEQAGWSDTNGDGIREKEGNKLILDFPTHGGFPRFLDVGPILQAQLADVGAELNLQPLAAPAWMEAGRTGNLNIGITQWRNRDPGLVLRIVFYSPNATSFAWNWHMNKKLDTLIEQGMLISDQNARCSLYEEIQKITMNDAMVRPLHQWQTVWAVRNEVEGFKLDNSFPLVFWAFDVHIEQ